MSLWLTERCASAAHLFASVAPATRVARDTVVAWLGHEQPPPSSRSLTHRWRQTARTSEQVPSRLHIAPPTRAYALSSFVQAAKDRHTAPRAPRTARPSPPTYRVHGPGSGAEWSQLRTTAASSVPADPSARSRVAPLAGQLRAGVWALSAEAWHRRPATHTHAHTHTRARARTHTHTRTAKWWRRTCRSSHLYALRPTPYTLHPAP